jgi:hypothetical protein
MSITFSRPDTPQAERMRRHFLDLLTPADAIPAV